MVYHVIATRGVWGKNNGINGLVCKSRLDFTEESDLGQDDYRKLIKSELGKYGWLYTLTELKETHGY